MEDWSQVRDILIIGAPIFGAGGIAYMVRGLTKEVADIKVDFKEEIGGIRDDMKAFEKVIVDVAISNQRQEIFERYTREEFGRMRDDLRSVGAWRRNPPTGKHNSGDAA